MDEAQRRGARQVLEGLRDLTGEESRELLMSLGYWRKDGKLKVKYGGTGRNAARK